MRCSQDNCHHDDAWGVSLSELDDGVDGAVAGAGSVLLDAAGGRQDSMTSTSMATEFRFNKTPALSMPRRAMSPPPTHGSSCAAFHRLKPLGLVPDAFCGCNKSTCRMLRMLDKREMAGYQYEPKAIDTRSVDLEASSPGTDVATYAVCLVMHVATPAVNR
jgi:hypothetical protein